MPLEARAIPPSSWLLHELVSGKLSSTLKAFHKRIAEGTKDRSAKPPTLHAKEAVAAQLRSENAARVRVGGWAAEGAGRWGGG
jgi:hypothetical protein